MYSTAVVGRNVPEFRPQSLLPCRCSKNIGPNKYIPFRSGNNDAHWTFATSDFLERKQSAVRCPSHPRNADVVHIHNPG